jgi:uncharacterized protein (TIGR02246 family)
MSTLTKLSVEDRLDIMELLVRYGRTLDARDAAGYAALFAPDAVRVTGNGTKVQHGRAEIQADIQQSMDGWRTTIRHFMAPPIIEDDDGNTCTARSYVQEMVDVPEGPCYVSQVAEYQDVLVKLDGQWYFKERKIVKMLDGHADTIKQGRAS